MPSASLLRLNRHLLPNVLVVGGAPDERAAMVRTLHRQSLVAVWPLCALEARGHAAVLERALLFWLGHSSRPPLLECERGTLFVDDIAALPTGVQRLLLRLSRRAEGVPAAARRGPGPARFAAGSSTDLTDEVARGRLLPDLFDSLEKLSIHLGPARRVQSPRLAPLAGAFAPLMPTPGLA
ncbi:MAG: sigma 54-interacting transcriptional regulator [Candidatus Eisenbacteria bacterium]